ncbi:MAG: hypothetical protein KDE27_14565, partial [Planctomycetes bacterium]|nr:hypothetical protein [Planctomycetota bacterium]
EIAAGIFHSLARRSDGSVVAWGDNSFGQTIVPALPAGLSYVEVAAGAYHSLARRSDGSVVAWGRNTFGQADVPPDLLPAHTAITGGELHGLALQSDGRITAWGSNTYGQLDVPHLAPGQRYTAVAAGYRHSLALQSDGEVVGWGDDSAGQATVPALPSGMTYVAIAAGRFHSMGLRSDGSLVGWGNSQTVPALAPGLSYVAVDTASGGYWNVALVSDGSLRAFGYNGTGQVSQAPTGTGFVEVSAGIGHGVARRGDGTLVAWGDDSDGQVSQLPTGTFSQLGSGWQHSVALRRDGQLVAWGVQGAPGPTAVTPAPDGFEYVEVAAGSSNSYGRYARRGVYLPTAGTGEVQWSAQFLTPDTTSQTIYDSSHFATQGIVTPVEIDRIELRRSGGVTNAPQTWPDVSIYLGYSATDYTAPSTTLASNRGPGYGLVYSGAVTATSASGQRPNDWVITVELDSTFTYDPMRGEDLLVELVAGPGSPVMMLASTVIPSFHQCRSVLQVGGGSPALSDHAPVLRLGYRPTANAAYHTDYGQGCSDRRLSFYERFPGNYPLSSNDLAGKTVRLTPNGNGGYDVTTTAGATVVPPTTAGLALPSNAASGALPLGFTFPYPGGNSATQVWAHSNGLVTLSGPGSPYMANTSTANELLFSSRHMLAAAMQNLECDGATNVHNVYAEPGGPGEFRITWWDVPPHDPPANAGVSRFQVALFDDGAVEYRYESLANASSDFAGAMVVGFSLGGGALDPGGSDLSNELVTTAGPEVEGLVLRASQRPVLGQSVDYSLDNLSPTLGISTILASFVAVDPGQPLTGLGIAAPGCDYMVSPFANVPFSPLLLGASTVSFAHGWPATTAFAGLEIALQGFHFDTAANAAGVRSSNGLLVRLDVQ